MTREEAQAEAGRRWSRRRRQGTMRGSFDRTGVACPPKSSASGFCEVGYAWNKCRNSWNSRQSWRHGSEILGRGETWEAAFADADRRAAAKDGAK